MITTLNSNLGTGLPLDDALSPSAYYMANDARLERPPVRASRQSCRRWLPPWTALQEQGSFRAAMDVQHKLALEHRILNAPYLHVLRVGQVCLKHALIVQVT